MPILKQEVKVSESRISSTPDPKRIKNLEITRAYAQYKMRSAGDLDNDLINWNYNLMYTIENEKSREKTDDSESSVPKTGGKS